MLYIYLTLVRVSKDVCGRRMDRWIWVLHSCFVWRLECLMCILMVGVLTFLFLVSSVVLLVCMLCPIILCSVLPVIPCFLPGILYFLLFVSFIGSILGQSWKSLHFVLSVWVCWMCRLCFGTAVAVEMTIHCILGDLCFFPVHIHSLLVSRNFGFVGLLVHCHCPSLFPVHCCIIGCRPFLAGFLFDFLLFVGLVVMYERFVKFVVLDYFLLICFCWFFGVSFPCTFWSYPCYFWFFFEWCIKILTF